MEGGASHRWGQVINSCVPCLTLLEQTVNHVRLVPGPLGRAGMSLVTREETRTAARRVAANGVVASPPSGEADPAAGTGT